MRSIRRRVAMVAAVSGLAVTAAPAQAGTIADHVDCTQQAPMSQVFLPWADLANYGLSPDGGFEGGGAGWSLTGGAGAAAGNESYFVHSGNDGASLSMPAGSSATSAPTCVGLQYPTIRFFSRASGTGLLSRLRVDVLFDDAVTGATRSLPIGTVLPGGSWQLTPQMVIAVNTLGALSEDGMVPVAFRFTPAGQGQWQLDDLYVDPWRGP
jgi:hypothetical protein